MDRRQLVLGLATLPLAHALSAGPGLASGSSNVHVIDMGNAPFFDRDAVPSGLDGTNACTRPNHGFLETLVNAGIDTVIRYFSDENNANLNCKNVTRRERDILGEHALALAIVYQFEGRAKGRYTGARAEADARFCLQRAAAIGQPPGSAIYFGVDSDAALNTDRDVLDYFAVVNRIFAGRFAVGIYAAGARCGLVRNAGLARYFWVPEAPAWAGTRDFLNSGMWSMYQNKTNINASAVTDGQGQTLHIDTNLVNPDAVTSIGAFLRDGSEMTYDPARLRAITEARRWVTADRLELLDAPGGAPNGHVCIARNLHVVGTEGDWAWVDINEDGLPDGWCRRDALAPFHQMPRWRRSTCKLMDI